MYSGGINENHKKYSNVDCWCLYCFSICSSIDSILFGDAKAEFPSKPIKVYVGFKPGSHADLIARMVAKHITDNKMLSQPIVIVNKPGAAAANAARAVWLPNQMVTILPGLIKC